MRCLQFFLWSPTIEVFVAPGRPLVQGHLKFSLNFYFQSDSLFLLWSFENIYLEAPDGYSSCEFHIWSLYHTGPRHHYADLSSEIKSTPLNTPTQNHSPVLGQPAPMTGQKRSRKSPSLHLGTTLKGHPDFRSLWSSNEDFVEAV